MKKQDQWQSAIRMHRIPKTDTYRIIYNDDGITRCSHWAVAKSKAKNVYRNHTGKRLADRYKRGYY
jgi:hypothetical protein